jgi:hypothetical protein
MKQKNTADVFGALMNAHERERKKYLANVQRISMLAGFMQLHSTIASLAEGMLNEHENSAEMLSVTKKKIDGFLDEIIKNVELLKTTRKVRRMFLW